MSLEAYKPLLESCAETGNIDYDAWPSLLPPLIERLTYIAHNDFPIPQPYPVVNPVLPSQRSIDSDRFIHNPPILPSNAPTTPRNLPPVPPFPGSSASRVPDSQPQSEELQNDAARQQLPIEVVQFLEQSLKTLRTYFDQKPPHTVQRLSELVLHPTQHYRTLPAWLRALDRVVSVSSGADIFPLSDLPPVLGNGAVNGTDVGGILFAGSSNDTRNGYDMESLGSDESLGGALLTPIPWLKDTDTSSGTDSSTLDSNSKVESWQDQSPEDDILHLADNGSTSTLDAAQAIAAVAYEQNGEGIVLARPDGAVTQGELIRMEQEAGVVPVPHEDIGRIGDEGIEIDDDGDNMPHARGPDLVSTIDMGKVGGQERQVHISSPPEEAHGTIIDTNDAREALSGGSMRSKNFHSDSDSNIDDTSTGDDFVTVEREDAKSKTDSLSDDGDIVLVDADNVFDDNPDNQKADSSTTQ